MFVVTRLKNKCQQLISENIGAPTVYDLYDLLVPTFINTIPNLPQSLVPVYEWINNLPKADFVSIINRILQAPLHNIKTPQELS